MSELERLRSQRDEILAVAKHHGAVDIRVFGSVARDDAQADSDVDFLINCAGETSSWFPAGLVLDLEELLGRRVDVVTERAIYEPLRERILAEAVAL